MKILHTAALIGLAMAVTACSTTKPPAPPRPGSIPAQIEELGQMEYLQVIDLKATKHNQLMVVQAELYNASSENQQLFYRFKWIDANGFTIGSDEPWKPLGIYGLQRQTINAVAPSPQVVDFRLVVQSPENNGQ